jgi:hypothetical protein
MPCASLAQRWPARRLLVPPVDPRRMDELSALQSLGLELPGPGYIVGAIVFGLIGLVAFRRGRKNGHRATLWLGVALMIYPYAVSGTLPLYVVGGALCAALWVDGRRHSG